MSAPKRPQGCACSASQGKLPVARRSVSAELAESKFDMQCKPERLRVAHPCAHSRSTAHPVHKGYVQGFTGGLGVSPVTRCKAIHGAQRIASGFDMLCKPERLRAAHPCALSRSTVHPEHKKPGVIPGFRFKLNKKSSFRSSQPANIKSL